MIKAATYIMMGSGSGVMMHAITTLRNNRRLLRRKSRFKKERSFLNLQDSVLAKRDVGIKVEKISNKTLSRIRSKMRSQTRAYNMRFALFLMISLPILLYGGYYIFKNYTIFPTTVKVTPDLSEKYYFFLEDGDKWLRQHKYHNAIFQYEKALQLFPSEYDAHYRLALVYAHSCERTFKGCEQGKLVLSKILKQYPNKSELLELKLILYGSID